MSTRGETRRIVKKWIEHAEEDLRVAMHALGLKSPTPYKIIAFHAQQCAEKYLKAFLALKEVDFPYTHNIALLVELCSPIAEWTQRLQGLEVLSQFAVTTRYPGKERVTRKEALKAIELATLARKVIKSELRREGMI